MTESLTSDQALIKKLTEIVLTNLGNKNFDVKELASESGISRSALNRKLRNILNKNINQFIREVRLKKAFEVLKNGSATASEVAYKVGFASPAYFNACFHEFFGYPPGKVKSLSSEIQDENTGADVTSGLEHKKSVLEIFTIYKKWILAISVLILIVAVIAYPKIFNQRSLDDLRSPDGRISVAVMPFQNMTDDKIWDGIQINLISYLSNYEELKVRQKEAVSSLLEGKGLSDNASITLSVAGRISQKLNANIFINGIINKAGNDVRVDAQLANSKTKEVFKSFQIEGPSREDKIFEIIDSLSLLIKNFLVISKMGKEINADLKPYKYSNSSEAYKYFILADVAYGRNDVKTALTLYSQSVAADSNFIPAIIFLSMRYMELGLQDEARKLCLKAYEKRDKTTMMDRIMVDWYHAQLFETPYEEIKYLRQYQDADDQVPVSYWQAGYAYLELFQYSNAIPEFEKALEIYKKWGTKPMMMANYTFLGFAYHKTGQYKKEKKLYRRAEKVFPDNPDAWRLYYRQAILAFTEGDIVGANRYIGKYRSALENLPWSEAEIVKDLALLYSEADVLNKAEEYYRQTLSLEPENQVGINDLAYFLIDRDQNINEGMNINNAVLKLNPDNPDFLHTKGWGLYKQGKSIEALEILQKSWDLKPAYDYDHGLFLHLGEVKKAVSGQG